MATSPYAGLPRRQIWKRAVASVAPEAVDPQDGAKFTIARTDRIASAGSCFARNVASRLQAGGFAYHVTEPGGAYSARYGDIYTTLQLSQLARRCIGTFAPEEAPWLVNERFHDPFRPRVEPGGFASVAALEADRADHLAAVRRLLVESDVFIFTLGLTEVWCTRADGAALPLCPGAGFGTFDPERYVFRNLDVDENVALLEEFLTIAWSLNPRLRVILTVSPVPLVATIEPRHVVQATTYSKSVLRVAAETLRRRHDAVDYFAAYEMIATPFAGGGHFAEDRREVTPASVDRAMRAFFASFAPEPAALPTIELSLEAVSMAPPPGYDPCDDEYLQRFLK